MVANLIDSLLGDQQLVNWLYFDSRSVLRGVFFKDWLNALPVMYLIFYLLVMPVGLLSRKFFNASLLLVYIACIAIVAGCSYIAGFRELGLVINSLTVFFIITFDYFSKVL